MYLKMNTFFNVTTKIINNIFNFQGQTPSSYTGPDSAKSGEFYSYINARAAQSNDIAIYKNAYMNLPGNCML